MTDVEEQKIENEKKQQELKSAYRRLFDSDDGKIVGEDLERFCGFLNTSVSQQSPDAYQTFFNEGKRRVYLRIIGMMKVKEKKNG
jgi:Ca2+-binding EF-hand superfamily protein